jgi:hypothetical protein
MTLGLSCARQRFDHFELDEADARLTCAGEPLALAPKPLAVLCALARMPRMLVSKNALLDAVWGHRFVTESVLKSAISEVRYVVPGDFEGAAPTEPSHTCGPRRTGRQASETTDRPRKGALMAARIIDHLMWRRWAMPSRASVGRPVGDPAAPD